MRQWTKYPTEEFAVGRNWTKDLDGALIIEALAPVIAAGSEVVLEYIETDGNVTKYVLRGGCPGSVTSVLISIRTDEGEILSDKIPVVVHR